MKITKLLFLLFAFCFYGQNLCSQISIPDALLKEKLVNATLANQIAFDQSDNPIILDPDGNGEIEMSDASQVYRLNLHHISGNRITSIIGLDQFTNLNNLNLRDNDISVPNELYDLSATLRYLDISFNRSLDNQTLAFAGTNLNSLETLKASAIGLNTIDITGLSSLQEVDLSYNLLTSLDLTGCVSLQTINASINRFPNVPLSGINSLTYGAGEMNNVITLDVSTNKFLALNLADFPNLETLNVYENEFTSLDVSLLYNLRKLSCHTNNLDNINFGTINQLTDLSCSKNNLSNIDLSNLTLLSHISCSDNDLTAIDISNLINLQDLFCANNQLMTLDASNNSLLAQLNCSNNSLESMYLKNNGPIIVGESFGFNNNPNLNYICEDADQISYINTYINQYGYTGITVDSNCDLDPPCIDLVAIPDPNFEQALLDQNIDTDGQLNGTICRADAEVVETLNISEKNISDLTGIEAFINIEVLSCIKNNISTLDLSQNILLKTVVAVENEIATIDISQCTQLEELWLNMNELSTIDISQNIQLRVLLIDTNQLSTIDLSQNIQLENLSVKYNQLSVLDVSQNTNLVYLICSFNNITTLDLSANIVLRSLYCRNNLLTSIDVSTNTVLENLGCSYNELTSLDLSVNTALEGVGCSNNEIVNLDFSTNVVLFYLECYNNNLESLNLKNGNNTNIAYMDATNNVDLTCILVDDVAYATSTTTSWYEDPIASYNDVSCPLTPIPAPIIIGCNATKRRMELKWQGLRGVDGYQVEVTLGNQTTLYNVPVTQNNLMVAIPSVGSLFTWRVRGVINNNGGTWSTWVKKCSGLLIDIEPIFLSKSSKEPNTTSFVAYPNPIQKGSTLYITNGEKAKSMIIYNLNGKVVYQADKGIDEIDTNDFKSGIYILKVQTDKDVITRSIVLE